MEIQELRNCRVCKDNGLDVVLDLGKIYPSGFYKEEKDISDIKKVPLILCKCNNCGLIQLKYTIEQDLMYRQYWYVSSLNKSMVSSLKNIVNYIESRLIINDGDSILDIGANDCSMLNMYSNKNAKTIGFDPSLNLERSNCDKFINDYFTAEKYFETTSDKAKVITAIAMYYDLPDPIKFTQDVKSILHENGIFIIQFTDLTSMLKITAYDNICIEHLNYYRLEDVKHILEQCGLEIIDVSYNNVNGGSLRVTASHLGHYVPSESVKLALINEFIFLSHYSISDFSEKIETVNSRIKRFLNWTIEHKYITYILGASTKGNTFLQVCNINNEQIPFAAEVNKEKFGLKTIGTNICIIPEERALKDNPDFFIILPWHFLDFFVSKYDDYLEKGGIFLVPLPEPRVITKHGTEYI